MTRAFVKPELLAPAGNMEKGKMALLYGADAIYLGGKMFGLRAFANNFDLPEIAEIAAYAHSLGKKVYVTVNIFAHNDDITKLPEYLRGLEQAKVDALLISDLGVWQTARQVVPNMALHVSTQHYQFCYGAGVGAAGRGARGFSTRAILKGDCRNQCQNRGGAGNLRAWRDVHFLQRSLPFEQLFNRS